MTSISSDVTLSSRQIEGIMAINHLNLSVEAERLWLPHDEAETLKDELKKFFALQVVEPGSYVIPGPVDQLWHALLEDEEKVAQLELQMGVRVQHRPDNPPDRWHDLMQNTKLKYKAIFGVVPHALYEQCGMLCWGCGEPE
jgi:hypothetical protein